MAAGLYEVTGENSLGGRFAWDGRLEPSKKISFSARTEYNSSEVTRGFREEETESEVEPGADSLSYGLGINYRPAQQLAYSLNHTRTERSVFEGVLDDDRARWSETSAASVSFKPFVSDISPWTYLSWDKNTSDKDESIRRLTGQLTWRYDKINLLVRHVDQLAEDSGQSWLSTLELSRDPWVRYFRKNSNLKLSPRLNAWKNSETLSANLGALVTYDSGKLLGDRTHLGMTYGKNLGVQVIEESDEQASDDGDNSLTEGSDYFSAGLTYRFNRMLKFTSNYYSNLDGEDDLYSTLTAYYEFNPPRNIKQSRENAGLLTGQVFLDQNHDGIQQENEQGIAGARVNIKGTRVGLNADPNGRFTIQNLPVGVYRIQPDTSRMPLGYIDDPEKVPPVRIGAAQITELKIPIVLGNQLSGVVYIDTNANGKLDKEDERLENIGLELGNQHETASTVFGQYTFDFLPPGKYTLFVQQDTLPDGVIVDPQQSLDIELRPGIRNKLLIRLLDH